MPTSREHIERLIFAHKRRLDELEVKAATLGSQTPPEITTEIEDIRLDVVKLEASLGALEKVNELGNEFEEPYSVDRRNQSSYDQRIHIMIATVQSTVAEFLSLRNFVDEKITYVLKRQNRLSIITLVGIAFIIFLMFYFRQ